MAATVMAGSGKTLPQSLERLIGGDQHAAAFVSGGDQLEQDGGLGLVFVDVGEVVEDQQVVFVELGDGGLQREGLSGELQPLDEIGGAGEQHAKAVLDQGMAEACREMRFAGRPAARSTGCWRLSPASRRWRRAP